MKRWPVKVTRSCCGDLEFRSDDLPVRGTGKAPRAVMPTICAANAVYSTTCSRKTPRICRSRNTDCVEAYAGGWAMARDLRAAGKDVQTVNDVVQCLKGGDSTAQQLLRRAGRILGLAVADAVSLFNPSVVSVCGQLAGTDEQLLAGIREVVYQRSLPLAIRNLQIVRSQLDPRAGLLGLSVLLSEEISSLERIGALISS